MVDIDYNPQEVEETCYDIKLGKQGRQRLTTSVLEKYDLYDTVADLVVTQGDASVVVTDANIDSQGRFHIPKKKIEMYGLEIGEPISVYVDRVVIR